MARILDFFLHRNTGKACKAYPDHETWMHGLLLEEPGAIQCLSSKIAGSVYQLGKGFNLTDEDIEELQCDCILLFIRKLREGQYVYRGHNPASFVIEIAKKRVRFVARQARRNATRDLEPDFDLAEDIFPGSQVRVELLKNLLQKIGDNCQRLIQLYYLEELKDKEVIEQALTQYTTVDALKNYRAKCMKKLVELATEMKTSAA